MKIGIVNINSGNIYSLCKILNDLSVPHIVCNSTSELKKTDKLIIPGVGSFYEAMKYLNHKGYSEEIKEAALIRKIDIMGICLGMQVLFEHGEEFKNCDGLGILKGNVQNLKKKIAKKKLPHIGWNSIEIKKKNKILLNIETNTDFYFAHSYAVEEVDETVISSTTNYEVDFISTVNHENIFGVQFHPEKSSLSGFQIIKNFIT